MSTRRPCHSAPQSAPAPGDPVAAACHLFDRAVACHEQGRLARAIRLARQALRLLSAAEGPDHPDVANVLNTLGQALADRGDFARAERVLRRAVRILGRTSGDVLAVRIRVQGLSRLANLYRAQGQYRRAAPLYRRALALAIREL
ncbi:MAG: tetratricopeptide repeat protein, partial [Planctomycetes bacterium]|nr:tetratricopeptide repeat protein [Planctomycetota bacterium]